MRRSFQFGVLALSLIILSSRSMAGEPALTFTGGIVSDITNDTVVGWRFTADAAVTVDALGMYDTDGDGFRTATEVGLWDINGALLATASVTSADPIDAGFRFSPIAPLRLTAGQDYVVAGTLNADTDGDNYVYNVQATTVSGITFVDSRAIDTSTLQFPTSFLGNRQGWFGGNISVVPEPNTFALAGVSVLAMACRRRRN
ncbi:MAG: DUF4082 domain-containing protein [Planctomycetota bacterium]